MACASSSLSRRLGMRDTGFWTSHSDRLATAYRPTPDGLVAWDEPGGTWSRPPAFGDGAGGLVSTVDDLSDAMRASAISVSQCGYNTALDILRAGVPALVVPFADNGDSEQSERARRLERLGAVRVLEAERLRTGDLATAIRATIAFVPNPLTLNLDGAPTSARILSTMQAARASHPHGEDRVLHERLA